MNFELRDYRIRRKVLKILGASFHVYDPDDNVIAFNSQKAFKLKEDIRVYADESKSKEILSIQARQIVDFAGGYDVIDTESGRKVGAVRRKGFSSIVRDSWELLDEDDRPIAKLAEDSVMLALVRRFLSNLVPQKFEIRDESGAVHATLKVAFNPFVYNLHVHIAPDSPLPPRLVFATAVLIAAIEGRQQ